MSDRPTRITRRTLLQVSGLAPFVALATSRASAAQVLKACSDVAPIPDTTMTELVRKAQARATQTGKPLDEAKFRLVAQVLWCYFVIGADPTPILDVNAVVLGAYDQKNDAGDASGDLVVDRLGEWDAQGHHPATDVCAYLCGSHADEVVDNQEGTGIGVVQYKEAFNQTEKEMKTKMNRLREFQRRMSSASPLGIRGLGC